MSLGRKATKAYDEIADVGLQFNGRCVYFTRLNLNVCHVTCWNEAHVPTKRQREGDEGGWRTRALKVFTTNLGRARFMGWGNV